MRRAKPQSGLPEDFALTEATAAFLDEEFPTIDPVKTLVIFKEKAEQYGWMYASWQAAFRNYIRNAEKFGGVTYRAGKTVDPLWTPILAESRKYGFRDPLPHESPQGFKTAFTTWKSAPKPEHRPLNVTGLLKAV